MTALGIEIRGIAVAFLIGIGGLAEGAPSLLEQRATDLFRRQQYLLSAVQFSIIGATASDSATRYRANLGYALALGELGEAEEQRSVLENLAPGDRDRLRLWNARRDPEAFHRFLDRSGSSQAQKKELLALRDLWADTHPKRPLLAGALGAVIPGLGHAYVGSWQSAFLTLALNGLFAATTIEFANHQMWAATAASGLVFSVVYVGNVLSAAGAASAYNDAHRAPLEADLRQRIFPLYAPR